MSGTGGRLLIVDRGEFGWTLCALLPRARVIAQHYRDVLVVTPAGREWLWRGCAHSIHSANAIAGSQEFLSGRFEQRDDMRVGNMAVGRRVWPSQGEAAAIVRDERAGFREPLFAPSLEKQWGDLVPNPYRAAELARQACPGGAPQVCVAVRPPKLLRGQTLECKSWPAESLQELAYGLLSAGQRVAIVGGPDNLAPALSALSGMGLTDLRGAPLETLCAVLAAARVTVGPSSGPLHLSQLCRTPIVTWYGIDAARPGSRNRYYGSWNPYRVPCFYLPDSCPTPGDVLVQTLAALNADRTMRTLT